MVSASQLESAGPQPASAPDAAWRAVRLLASGVAFAGVFGFVVTIGFGAAAQEDGASPSTFSAAASSGTVEAPSTSTTLAAIVPPAGVPVSEQPTTQPPPSVADPETQTDTGEGATTGAESTIDDGGMQSSTDGGSTPTTLSDDERAERDRLEANLDLARAADQEVANELRAITADANRTVEKIEAARQRIEESEQIREQTAEQLAESDQRQEVIEDSLRVRAVEGYKSRSIGGSSLLFVRMPINSAVRQEQLLNEANDSTADLLEELRGLVDDRQLATLQAAQAAEQAQRAERLLQAELDAYQEQLSKQVVLKNEAERRVDAWAGELTAYAAEDAGIQTLIDERTEPVDTAINNPTAPSALGFQWPVDGAKATSEYGYRIHPVYGTRRLHAGIDLGAPRGTPILAANDGTVIFVGPRGGYGRTVMVDHGESVTTLYAHMTDYNVADGDTVNRGDVVGFVGATGTATGNHLHFEVRVNGGAVNPRGYLP